MDNKQGATFLSQLANTTQLSLSGSAANSTVAPSDTNSVRIFAVADAWVRVGSGAVAAANTSMRMTAGMVEYFRAGPGDRVSAIQAASGGTVDVTWMT